MIAQPTQATALSLWDPTFDIPERLINGKFSVIEEKDFYIWNKNRREVILGKDFIEERRSSYNADECLALSKSLSHVPIQVIAADDRGGENKKSYHSEGHDLNHRIIIENADHCFWRGNVFQQVLDHSLEWFEKF